MALIVGGSSGIGKLTGKRLLNRGADVMLLISTAFILLAEWAALMTSLRWSIF
jgi:NAD(P)-dependent dehydrogenase (short-subunit alcohol dehydrogenase family)